MSSALSIVLGSLVGDALSLGPHWVYDQSVIADELGAITTYHTPISDYHPGKEAGDFTHYGDQVLLLLASIEREGRFELEDFAAHWQAFWEDTPTTSYRDGATKSTLERLATGRPPSLPGSRSNDLAGAARIAPLFLLEWESDEALFAAARAQTRFTHGNPAVIEAAEFIARVVLAVQRGREIPAALEMVAALDHWEALPADWLSAAQETSTSDQTDRAVAADLGLTCHMPDAFPLVLYFLLRYPEDPVTALQRNAEAGGDSAARGLILGMIYGARFGSEPLPAAWIEELRLPKEATSALAF